MNILEKINSPADLKQLSTIEREELCREIREFLVSSVSKTGGHLASNLGIVELTLAIHETFELSRDRLIFDVGHQCYVHKIITGRHGQFDTLRQMDGLSGFPKPEESHYDAFIAGHASNSISVALGMIRARRLSGTNHCVIALIGDGALTGGLAYEALCDAGCSGEPLIVILNDNGMSITENVGGMARYLSRQRLKPSYLRFKKLYRRVTDFIPGGRAIYKLTHAIKTAFKRAILHCSMFEEMGFQYIGPVDGHSSKELRGALSWAREMNKPVLVHVVTQKGRGYTPSEGAPEAYHGVSSFDPEAGIDSETAESFSSVFGKALEELAGENEKVVAVTAAMTAGTGLSHFAEKFPQRIFDVGIAEGHAVSMAAGLAEGGMLPVVAIYSTFLQRSYDMLLHDMALMNSRAVLAVDRAGIVPGDGETHQGVYDTSYLATVPGLKLYAPASFAELRDMLTAAVKDDCGTVAVRYPKGAQGQYTGGGTDTVKRLRAGNDVTLVTYGIMVNIAIEAAALLECRGVDVEIIKLGVIAPLDTDAVAVSVSKTGALIVLEDSARAGSVGDRLVSKLATDGALPHSSAILSTEDKALPAGTAAQLRELCGLDGKSVAEAIWELCRDKNAS